jgi:hypothetical protein
MAATDYTQTTRRAPFIEAGSRELRRFINATSW